MRIACLHVPQFALQCVTRADPSLRGAAIVVAGTPEPGGRSGPVVQACSRAAWALGARVGMTAAAARNVSPDLQVVSADVQRERDTVRAIADVVLAVSGIVDVGGRSGAGGAHLAMYCDVPSKTRGASFGDRLLEKLELLGLTGRIGIADDRFTAWVAAAADQRRDDDGGVVSVPRGGSPAFLAPRPLSLLAISPEVQHMLEALGIGTLGEFAALPAPSIACRPGRSVDADYQALARGEGGHVLRPYAPDAPIREEIAIGEATSLAAAVAVLGERVAARLAGRGRGAMRIDLAIAGASGERVVPVSPRRSDLFAGAGGGTMASASSAEELADAIGAALGDTQEERAWRLRAVVSGETLAEAEAAPAAAAEEPATIVDTLSLVLSNTGGSLDLAFNSAHAMPLVGRETAGLLRAERREAHRRTRRGKQRRRPDSLVQPRLFKT